MKRGLATPWLATSRLLAWFGKCVHTSVCVFVFVFVYVYTDRPCSFGAHAWILLCWTPDGDTRLWHLPQMDPKSPQGLSTRPYALPEMGVRSGSVSIWRTGHLHLPGSRGGRPLGELRDPQRPHTGRGLAGWRRGRRGLSLGAHLPERQEPLPGPPPEIRWAENAKNRDFETLLPCLAPKAGCVGPP